MPQPLPPESVPRPIVARIITLFGTSQVGLLVAKPNWDTEIKITQELPTDVSKEPITFVESRRNFAQSARYHMEWTSYLSSAADATELRIFLLRVRGLPILVPLWPDVCETSTNTPAHSTQIHLVDVPARYGGVWIITDETFTTWEIVAISALDTVNKLIRLPVGGVSRPYPAGSFAYPLITGRLEEQPQAESITDETADVPFKLKENAAFYLRLLPATATLRFVGPNIPKFQTSYLWDIAPNHSRPMDWTENPTIVYETIGFLREEQQRVYEHPTPRGQELEFYQSDRASIARIEYFWRAHRANTLRFMIPSFRGDLRMLLNTPQAHPHEKWILCERSFFTNPGRDPQPSDPYFALIDKNDIVYPHRVSIGLDTEPDQSTLIADQNVGAHTAATTIVSQLLLARFMEATLEWSYTTPYLATTKIKFLEVPDEYPTDLHPNPPVQNKEPAYIFIFKEAGIRTDRFTSYENAIDITDPPNYNGVSYAGHYVSAPFSFDTLKVGLKLDQEKLELQSFKFEGNPLNKMWPFALDGILTVEIVEVDAVAPLSSTALSRFYGDVWSIDSQYKATCIPFGNLFDRKFPRFLLSVSDNYTQFSPPTHIFPLPFKITGTVHGAVDHLSQTLLVTSGGTGGGHAQVSDYFAGGWLETGTGVNKEKRGILHSVASGTTDVTLTIDRPLLKAGTNQSLDMYPGYDGSIDQCDTKFHNRINFGGHAYIPNINPGVKAVKTKNAQGGKKG